MRVVVFHEYGLSGTGGNVYICNLCRGLCESGHDLILFCNESNPEGYDFITGAVELSEEGKFVFLHNANTAYGGKCHMFKSISLSCDDAATAVLGADETLFDLEKASLNQLEDHIAEKVEALKTVTAGVSPHFIISSGMVPASVICARAFSDSKNASHIIAAVGNSIDYAKELNEKAENYLTEGISSAAAVVFPSAYARDAFLNSFEDDLIADSRLFVFPPGVDTKAFNPVFSDNERKKLPERTREKSLTQKENVDTGLIKSIARLRKCLLSEGDACEEMLRIIEDISRTGCFNVADTDFSLKIRAVSKAENIVVFCGPLTLSKGPELLLLAAPLLLEVFKDICFLFIGSGPARGRLEALKTALIYGNLNVIMELLNASSAEFEKGMRAHPNPYEGFLEWLKQEGHAGSYLKSAERVNDRTIVFSGHIENQLVAEIIKCADVVVTPSVFPQPCGLAAMEALSSGLIPLSANHSGLSEIIKVVSNEFSDIFNEDDFMPMFPSEDLIFTMSNNVKAVLETYSRIDSEARNDVRRRAHQLVANRYSSRIMIENYLSI